MQIHVCVCFPPKIYALFSFAPFIVSIAFLYTKMRICRVLPTSILTERNKPEDIILVLNGAYVSATQTRKNYMSPQYWREVVPCPRCEYKKNYLKPEYWSTRAKSCIGPWYQSKKTYLEPGTSALLSAAVLPRLTQEDPLA